MCIRDSDIGMRAHVNGFYYVREAIHMVYHDASLLDHMMDGVYATIAERHQTSMQSVERVIRAAIEITWLRGNTCLLYTSIVHSCVDMVLSIAVWKVLIKNRSIAAVANVKEADLKFGKEKALQTTSKA